MLTLSEFVKDARLQVIGDLLDAAGSAGSGKIQFYDGTKPVNLGGVSTQNKLCELDLGLPSYTEVAGGVMTMAPTGTSLVLLSGEVTWARLLDRNGAVVGDLDVGGVSSGRDLVFPTDTAQVYQGANMQLNTWTIQ